MIDPDFARFMQDSGEAIYRTRIPESTIANWSNKLPPVLLDIWRQEGWAGYSNGRLWTVNPGDYEQIKDAWLAGTPLPLLDKFHVFARTAFGDLYLCGEKAGPCVTVSCFVNQVMAFRQISKGKPPHHHDSRIRAIFACHDPEDSDCTDTLDKPLFDRAMNKYGPLGPDEMYGFESPLVLGGRPTLTNLRRVKLAPYLLALREFSPPSLPGGGGGLAWLA